MRRPLHGCHESRGGRVELSEFGRKGRGIRKTKISLLGAQWVKGAPIYLSLMPSSGSWKYWVSNLEFMNSWIMIQQFNNHTITFLVCCSCARWLIHIFLLYLQDNPLWQVLLPNSKNEKTEIKKRLLTCLGRTAWKRQTLLNFTIKILKRVACISCVHLPSYYSLFKDKFMSRQYINVV